MESIEALRRILMRERKARKAAEAMLENKSRELYYANQELTELNESLEQKVAQRTLEIEESKRDLIEARDKAQAAASAKTDFLSNMSHEIRTPLNNIVGLTALILQDSKDSMAQEYASSIKYSADHLLSIINEILDFSKIEAGQMTLHFEPFTTEKFFQGLYKLFSYRAQDQNIELLLDIDSSIPAYLVGDSVKLNQIFTNLVGNALKFTREGSVTIGAKLKNMKSGIACVEFWVQDTGVGIPDHKLETIFESFQQASSSTTKEFGGTGLGLTITKRLVELHGGKIQVKSSMESGSTFSFFLPMKVSDAAHTRITPNGKEINLGDLAGLRVLVVEDIKMNRLLMKRVLERLSVEVEFAENGLEGIEKMSEHHYDVVLMDLHMPEMDGLTATRKIRQGTYPVLDPDVPIIGLTADAFNHVRQEMLDAGFSDYLAKPINLDLVYQKLLEHHPQKSYLL